MPLFYPPIEIAAGTQTANQGTVVLANSNGVTFGMSNSSVVTASINAVQSISAGTTNATGNQIVFANSNNVNFGVNGNTVTASVVAAADSQSINAFSHLAEFNTNYTINANFLSLERVSMPMGISGSAALVLLDISGITNSFGGVTVNMAAYSISNGPTLVAINPTTTSVNITWTSGTQTTASSIYGGVSGTRYRSLGWPVNMTPGDYLFAFIINTTNSATVRMFGRQGVNIVGTYAGFDTNYLLDGCSSTTVTGFPSSVFGSDANYVRTGLSALQQPGFILIGTT
jgi:hypothetical protein